MGQLRGLIVFVLVKLLQPLPKFEDEVEFAAGVALGLDGFVMPLQTDAAYW